MPEEAEKFTDEFARSMSSGQFVKLVLSNYKGTEKHPQKVTVRLIETKKGVRTNFQYRYETKDVTKNHAPEESVRVVAELIASGFRSGHLFTTSRDFQLTVGKKNSKLISGKPTFSSAGVTEHDRSKKLLVDPDAFYLKALGVTTDSGEIKSQQQAKWKQINKYVEILAGLIERSSLTDRDSLKIVDMGSGKGYLTFAAYDYLANVRGVKVSMTGVESRQKLVDYCNQVAEAVGFDGLRFVEGSIVDYQMEEVDILVALHACDTATDDALYKGITASADIIVAAPCCHQEVRKQIKPPDLLADILKHGTMLEREAETITDGLRSMLLEAKGYATSVFEFVATEHTPKNNMIVATKKGAHESFPVAAIKQVMEFYSIKDHRLLHLLEERRT